MDQAYAPPTVPAPDLGLAPVLDCRSLTKRYGSVNALNAVTFTIPRGRVVGLLGPNGSGKTTLIKLIAGLLQPTAGSAYILGEEPGASPKARVSYLPERPYFSPSMKVTDTLSFFADFYADFDRRLAEDMLLRLSVPTTATMGALSKGTKEKVQLVLVMARRAALYLLDEPIGGVDPAARDFILGTIIANYHRDSTILVSTHLVSDVEHALDDFILLQYGNIAMYSSPQLVYQQTGRSLDQYFREAYRC
ncbi:ABC transporter ATP-binding protein [Raoultibacter timonensis]|uniref:ABC transporter ATP-binding protein n=1 Tax=Raoultibacter timonensis TaxID=1907662 RepID=A0ABN6MGV9_9ACTN|nr:ABC transporter ATP-binding protein [Raoultibacter timonensis]BDE96245.1 ABC transporter ATP-binding protein [Raoultibacter timonensis]BDF50850.1 ABC transporter ATP-binding protein [Raoultibacter timonensis]